MQVRDVTTGQVIATAAAPGWSSTFYDTLQYSTDGRFALMGDGHLALRWSASAPRTPGKVALADSSRYYSWAISSDGSVVVSLGNEGIDVHDLGTGRLLRTVAAGAGAAQIMGLTPDGGTVVTFDASLYHAIDLTTGTSVVLGAAHPIATSAEDPDDVGPDDPGAAFTREPVSTQTTTGKYEQTEHFVLSRGSALARACQVAGRDLTVAEWAKYVAGVPYRSVCAE